MKGVLSDNALEEYNRNGFVRTGLHLEPATVQTIRAQYRAMPATASNWSYFMLKDLSHYAEGGWGEFIANIQRKLKARKIHRQIRNTVYGKSIYGTSDIVSEILEECVEGGLASFFSEVPLLVGHDIYLESDQSNSTFGYHEDGYGWEIFFQTEDDVTLYIPLHDVDASTGGRLIVDQQPDRNDKNGDRNQWLCDFSKICRDYGATDSSGQVTRLSVEKSGERKKIAQHFNRLLLERSLRNSSKPSPEEMQPVDSKAGEVIIFNNKRFHDVEPWKLSQNREIYIIRCFPLFDIGLTLPTEFLNGDRCNRFLLSPGVPGIKGLSSMDELPPFVPIPA